MDLAGKVAIVTGGGEGIGRAAAIALAGAGAATVVADIDQQAAEAVASEIVGPGGSALGLVVDASRSADVGTIAPAPVDSYGGNDLPYNKAAIQTYGSATAPQEPTLESLFAVNV